ncbi:hypothetical protein AVEN_254235-1 [Araneus ventricosus]|uniref:Uncharacterized protein n=1 Tax=Araneus ventricosus TaxID=182803 RepID=A0A4Y2S7S6_ARAVE|nr:hypothetical protein AVEN_254235-1 [Araneus ventricosus]
MGEWVGVSNNECGTSPPTVKPFHIIWVSGSAWVKMGASLLRRPLKLSISYSYSELCLHSFTHRFILVALNPPIRRNGAFAFARKEWQAPPSQISNNTKSLFEKIGLRGFHEARTKRNST